MDTVQERMGIRLIIQSKSTTKNITSPAYHTHLTEVTSRQVYRYMMEVLNLFLEHHGVTGFVHMPALGGPEDEWQEFVFQINPEGLSEERRQGLVVDLEETLTSELQKHFAHK